MGKVQILDCTLRDGGRCFGNAWGDEAILEISKTLSEAKIDLIELGFLWYITDGIVRVNTTVFQDPREMKSFMQEEQKYIAYIEYILFKKENHNILPQNETGLYGLRLGIYKDEIEEARETMLEIMNKGYRLFVQGINVLSYSEEELIQFIQVINEINPYAVAIVDTYGNMDKTDLKRIFEIVDKNLSAEITIDFHSHNNRNQSMELAKYLLEVSSERKIIVDATLEGIGMGAGNLSTGILAEYLNQELSNCYDLEKLRECSQKFILPFKRDMSWEPSSVTEEAAERWISNIETSYIMNYYCELTIEEKLLLVGMCAIGRWTGNHKIDEYYRVVRAREGTKEDYENLKKRFVGKDIVLIGGAPSAKEKQDCILQRMDIDNTIFVILNAKSDDIFQVEGCAKWFFFGDYKRFEIFEHHTRENDCEYNKIILAGLLKKEQRNASNLFVVNYADILGDKRTMAGDSMWYMLNFFCGLESNNKIYLAGFDGTDGTASERQIYLYKNYLSIRREKNNIEFLTESVYQ